MWFRMIYEISKNKKKNKTFKLLIWPKGFLYWVANNCFRTFNTTALGFTASLHPKLCSHLALTPILSDLYTRGHLKLGHFTLSLYLKWPLVILPFSNLIQIQFLSSLLGKNSSNMSDRKTIFYLHFTPFWMWPYEAQTFPKWDLNNQITTCSWHILSTFPPELRAAHWWRDQPRHMLTEVENRAIEKLAALSAA